MSFLINNLKMRCNILRISSPTANLDDEGMYNPTFIAVYTNIKCHLYYSDLTIGRIKVEDYGQDPMNRTIAILPKNTDIKDGDRIYCSDFYPYTFLVSAVNPVKNGLSGKLSHFECILDIENTN
jgi:hypothetical protein